MKKNILSQIIFVIVGLGIVLLIFGLVLYQKENKVFSRGNFLAALFSSGQKKEIGLSQTELADLAKPSAVRIIQYIKGEAEIPAFTIDLKNFSVSFLTKYKPLSLEIDNNITGSGFIINPDGYILTNTHVVSDEIIKRTIIGELITRITYLKALELSKEELDKLNKDPDLLNNFGLEIYKKVVAKSNFKLEKSITVINPSSRGEKITDLIEESFPADIIKINNNFADDNKDVAIIKIKENNLPAIHLGDSTSLSTGQKIYVFGFPATGTFDKKDLIESTFTQGVISAIKDSKNKDFKIFQSDAKISQGSSGGPLLNEKGEVVGIITFLTGNNLQQTGDIFAFAIPIEIGRNMMNEASIINEVGNYSSYFKTGLEFFKNLRCKKAITEFNLAKNTNSNFEVNKILDSYIGRCNELIARGESIDTRWDELKEWFKEIGYPFWLITVGGTLLFIVLIFIFIRLVLKMRKKEKEVSELEERIKEEKIENIEQEEKIEKIEKIISSQSDNSNHKADESLSQPIEQTKTEPSITTPKSSLDPWLVDYVKESRKAGLSDEAIRQELKKAGWPDSDKIAISKIV